MTSDALAAIATPQAVAVWLDDYGLGDLAPAFHARGWSGDALLDADETELEAVAGQSFRLLRRILKPLRELRFSPTPATRAELDRTLDDSRELGEAWSAHPGLATLIETWPGPIAHELHMLGELLRNGKVVGALLQMRDVAEVLIKLPAVIMARDLLEHDGPPEIQTTIRKTLFATELSMGTWLGLARALARAITAAPPGSLELLAPEVAALFVSAKDQLTPYYQALADQTTRRNWDLGHGAFRFDEGEILVTLRHLLLGDVPRDRWPAVGLTKVTPLAQGLALARETPCWDRLVLMLDTPASPSRPLCGWQSIRDYHHGAAPAGHDTRSTAVLAVRTDTHAVLRLTPYMAARTCGLCGHQDVFVFNGWDRKRYRYDLLDYLMGHRMRRPWHEVADLYEESQRQPLLPSADSTPPEADFSLTRGSVVALLDDTAFDKRYLSPTYLRQPLGDVLSRESRGLFWLHAPGHVGKSMFVLGLSELNPATTHISSSGSNPPLAVGGGKPPPAAAIASASRD